MFSISFLSFFFFLLAVDKLHRRRRCRRGRLLLVCLAPRRGDKIPRTTCSPLFLPTLTLVSLSLSLSLSHFSAPARNPRSGRRLAPSFETSSSSSVKSRSSAATPRSSSPTRSCGDDRNRPNQADPLRLRPSPPRMIPVNSGPLFHCRRAQHAPGELLVLQDSSSPSLPL